MPQPRPGWTTTPLLLLCFVLVLPVLALAASWLGWNAQNADVLRQMMDTAVAVSVGLVGMATACAVTLFDFPGRRTAEWALLLPLAMPAYVVAYAYTDFFQFSGPLQNWLRGNLGLQGRVFPEVRSLGGAVWVFTFALYPYVYLLARSALSERASHLMEAARLLGAPMLRRVREVALPLARPAVAAGIALALMETLADYGVASYFGIQTFTTGIYKAWLVMDNRVAAAQMATLLLATVSVLVSLERHAQQRLRFNTVSGQGRGSRDAQPQVLRGAGRWLAWAVCGVPVLAGFVLPVLFMLRPLASGWDELPWSAFWRWSFNSLWLAGLGAALATAAALWLAFVQRRQPGWLTNGWWWVCCCPWAGCRQQHLGPAWAIGSRPRCWVCCGPIWCALRPWRCSRCKAATRAFQRHWTIRPAC
jgi:iron(III) transport system permease protein